MRSAIVLCLLLPLVLAIQEEPTERLLSQMRGFADLLLAKLEDISFNLEESALDTPITPDPKANLVYGPAVIAIQNILAKKTRIEIPVIGNPSLPIYAENGVILGVDKTYVNIDAPNWGFDINNLTVYIPELDITADEYILQNLDLGVVVLNGNGPLRIKLMGVRLYAKMSITRMNKKYTVNKIPAINFDMENAIFDLENLGGSGEAMASLLNGIAGGVLPKLIKGASSEVQAFLDASNGDCSGDLYVLCYVLGLRITDLVNALVPSLIK